LQLKVKTVQPSAKSLKRLVVAEVAQVAYIYICSGACNPHIYTFREEGKNA